jgi:molybdopterin synthase catalytic subunit
MEHVPLDRALREGDEVAFFPPVSGGEGRLTREPLDPEALEREARTDACGCVVGFTGVVRDHHEGRAVEAVSYEAYPEMAEREMERVVVEAERRWPGVRARAMHRVGRMEVGEIVVAIAAAAPHREEAFEACRFLIEEIKRSVPIWKKDHFAAGEASWRDG